jgi:hypothetical protein
MSSASAPRTAFTPSGTAGGDVNSPFIRPAPRTVLVKALAFICVDDPLPFMTQEDRHDHDRNVEAHRKNKRPAPVPPMSASVVLVVRQRQLAPLTALSSVWTACAPYYVQRQDLTQQTFAVLSTQLPTFRFVTRANFTWNLSAADIHLLRTAVDHLQAITLPSIDFGDAAVVDFLCDQLPHLQTVKLPGAKGAARLPQDSSEFTVVLTRLLQHPRLALRASFAAVLDRGTAFAGENLSTLNSIILPQLQDLANSRVDVTTALLHLAVAAPRNAELRNEIPLAAVEHFYSPAPSVRDAALLVLTCANSSCFWQLLHTPFLPALCKRLDEFVRDELPAMAQRRHDLQCGEYRSWFENEPCSDFALYAVVRVLERLGVSHPWVDTPFGEADGETIENESPRDRAERIKAARRVVLTTLFQHGTVVSLARAVRTLCPPQFAPSVTSAGYLCHPWFSTRRALFLHGGPFHYAMKSLKAEGQIVVDVVLAAPDLAALYDPQSRAIGILLADVDPGPGSCSPAALSRIISRMKYLVHAFFASSLHSVEGNALSSEKTHIYAPVKKSNVRVVTEEPDDGTGHVAKRVLTPALAENFCAVKAYVGASPTVLQLLRAAITAAGQLRHRTSEREVLIVFSDLRWLLEPLFSIAALERHLAPQSGAAPAASSTSSSSDSGASDPLLVDKFLDEPEIQSFLNAM